VVVVLSLWCAPIGFAILGPGWDEVSWLQELCLVMGMLLCVGPCRVNAGSGVTGGAQSTEEGAIECQRQPQ
jgi:hypothetical protein